MSSEGVTRGGFQALPPEERTIGQLVAESLHLYAGNFWRALACGLGPAVLALTLVERGRIAWFAVMCSLGAVLLTASYVFASTLVLGVRERRSLLAAFVAGVVVFLPFPFLLAAFVLPGLMWLALVGLAVPAAVHERLGVGAALRRGLQLGRVDYVHAFASLLTLATLDALVQAFLFLLLHGQGLTAARTTAFVVNLVVSPVVLLGAALLYVDQAARVSLGAPTEEEADADVHPALDAEHARRADAEVEPRPAPRGEP